MLRLQNKKSFVSYELKKVDDGATTVGCVLFDFIFTSGDTFVVCDLAFVAVDSGFVIAVVSILIIIGSASAVFVTVAAVTVSFSEVTIDADVDWVDSSFRVVATGADATVVVVVVSVVVSVVGSARKNAVVFVNS